MKRYSEDHQWVKYEKGRATVGITAYAADELGDITFVELPEVGLVVGQGDVLCVVESAKAASDVYAPVGGTVVEVNQALDTSPIMVSDSPEARGWICKLEEVDESELENLMSDAQYEEFLNDDEIEE
jgi:glycine cleavage system H protein